MEVDTGSSVSLISFNRFKEHYGNVKLDKPSSILKTYSGQEIKQKGSKRANVTYSGQSKTFNIMCRRE